MVVPNDEEAGELLLEEDDVHPDAPIEETNNLQMHDIEDEDASLIPRFIQDQDIYHGRWRWIPPSLRRSGKKIAKWTKGPQPPKIQVIRPWLPHVQEAPIRFLDAYLPKRKHRIVLLLAFYVCWALIFGIVYHQGTLSSDVDGYGTPAEIGCGQTFWGPGNSCGLNGINCRPFYNGSYAFRCPGQCSKYMLLNQRAVGAEEVIYQPLVVGGPSEDGTGDEAVYRGDSFVCAAAIHAGVIENAVGGCGVVSLAGEQRTFPSTTRHRITSIGFDTYFPLSFTFAPNISCTAHDTRWTLLSISMAFSALLSLFTTSPALFFWSTFTTLFLHVGFASDSPPADGVASLFSILLGRFLPAAFCGFVIYRYCAIRTLTALRAQAEKTVFYLGAAWFGALSNTTLDWIPIQRLTSHDLKQQPGAWLALAVILTLLALVVVQQIHFFRLEGRLRRYLALYGSFVAAILFSLLLPNLNLRIHHYILALLLLPGTSMQTRPVLLYQGLLIGLFVNGIARWGFDSVLQTDAALRGDAPHYSQLPGPLVPVIALGEQSWNISFSWDAPPVPYDGFSVLVNDVERFRGFTDEGYGRGRAFVWRRDLSSANAVSSTDTVNTVDTTPDSKSTRQGPSPAVSGRDTSIITSPGTLHDKEFFRFGYMQGNVNWDYTRAGTWMPDGSWVEMEEGPSRRRIRGWGVGVPEAEAEWEGVFGR